MNDARRRGASGQLTGEERFAGVSRECGGGREGGGEGESSVEEEVLFRA